MFHQLLYVSVEKHPFTKAELVSLLAQSRAKNEKLGITGLLLYYKRHFLQVLEGEKEAAFDLFRLIRKDERHSSVILFWDQPIEKRSFADWTMALVNLNDVERSRLKGFSDFLEKGFGAIEDKDLTQAQKLLLESRNLL